MANLILTVKNGDKTLAAWTLDASPLSLVLTDPETGREVAQFEARSLVAATESASEIVLPEPEGDRGTDRRASAVEPESDDLTLPLPEVPASAAIDDTVDMAHHVASTKDEAPRTAEVWVRRDGEWRQAGSLVPRQRVTSQGGWVRHTREGRLIVCPGDKLSGSGTLPDGRTVEIQAGVDPISLPVGSTVLLGAGEHGLYVRSEPIELSDPRARVRSGLRGAAAPL